MPFKIHCFKGEGILHFVYSANHRKCSKTFGRHCMLVMLLGTVLGKCAGGRRPFKYNDKKEIKNGAYKTK